MSGARLAVIAALIVAAIVGIATWRAVAIGARAMGESDAAMAKSDAPAAIARARDAAEAAAPGSPYPQRGFARLEAIARDAEARFDERTAVAAWGAMRAACDATEGPLVATGAWRAEADEGIARAGSTPPPGSAEVHAGAEAIRAELGDRAVPAAFSLVILAAGALAFFAGALRLAWSARDWRALAAQRGALALAAAGIAIYVVASLRS